MSLVKRIRKYVSTPQFKLRCMLASFPLLLAAEPVSAYFGTKQGLTDLAAERGRADAQHEARLIMSRYESGQHPSGREVKGFSPFTPYVIYLAAAKYKKNSERNG